MLLHKIFNFLLKNKAAELLWLSRRICKVAISQLQQSDKKLCKNNSSPNEELYVNGLEPSMKGTLKCEINPSESKILSKTCMWEMCGIKPKIEIINFAAKITLAEEMHLPTMRNDM